MTDAELKAALFEFLKSEHVETELAGEHFTRENAALRLQALIPTAIEVKNICDGNRGIVVAAPHISFDGWSEFFARVTAQEFGLGRVLARHFRDDNEFDIPVSIGRHIHVNRPTESRRRRGRELETARARAAHEEYVRALEAAGGAKLPLTLLIEYHGHRRHGGIEIATTGVSADIAAELKALVAGASVRIEPADKLLFKATRAKRGGSLQSSVARRALHIELPRQLRRTAEQREQTWTSLKPLFARLLINYHI